MSKKVCRLCLQTVCKNYQTIGESLKNTLKLNLDVSKETVTCIECANNLQVFINFKAACQYTRNTTLPSTDFKNDINLGLVDTETTNNIDPFIKSKYNKIRCQFCTKIEKRMVLLPLNGTMKNKALKDILEEHIPELNLYDTEELFTCENCLDALKVILRFTTQCFDVEDKINKYTEIEGTDDKGQIDLKDVQRFIFKPTIKSEKATCSANELEVRCNEIQEGHTIKVEAGIKYEKEIDFPELIFKTDVDTQFKQNNCDSFQERSPKIIMDNGSVEAIISQTDQKKETKHKRRVKRRTLKQRDSAVGTIYRCKTCPFRSRHRSSIYQHEVAHKSPSEIKMFKCNSCSYETKRKDTLIQHLLIHKNPLDVTLYKCEKCAYETKRKMHIKRHILTHTTPPLKCDRCSYETKRKDHLDFHQLLHR